jgi:hypothetical protein
MEDFSHFRLPADAKPAGGESFQEGHALGSVQSSKASEPLGNIRTGRSELIDERSAL